MRLKMLHDFLMMLIGIGLSIPPFLISRRPKKDKPKPINVINGITLPLPEDPDWEIIGSIPEIQKSLKDPNNIWSCYLALNNVICAWKFSNNRSEKNDPEFTAIYIKSSNCFTILINENYNPYVLEVRRMHMKYMVENPEIKNLKQLES
jgi:hypothetical protein